MIIFRRFLYETWLVYNIIQEESIVEKTSDFNKYNKSD